MDYMGAAAWTQAVGSILAILAAIGLGWWQNYQARQLADRQHKESHTLFQRQLDADRKARLEDSEARRLSAWIFFHSIASKLEAALSAIHTKTSGTDQDALLLVSTLPAQKTILSSKKEMLERLDLAPIRDRNLTLKYMSTIDLIDTLIFDLNITDMLSRQNRTDRDLSNPYQKEVEYLGKACSISAERLANIVKACEETISSLDPDAL